MAGVWEQGCDFNFYIRQYIWLETNHYRIIDTSIFVQPHISGKFLPGPMVLKRALSLRVTREMGKDAKVALRIFNRHAEKNTLW